MRRAISDVRFNQRDVDIVAVVVAPRLTLISDLQKFYHKRPSRD